MASVKQKSERAGWAKRYQSALRRHVMPGGECNLQPASKLGRQAATLGMETLDVARIHEQALMTLVRPARSAQVIQRMISRAKKFFAETIVPIERTHRAARMADDRVSQLTRALRRRTVESSSSTRSLAKGVARRRAAEAALRESQNHLIKLLRLSRRQQHRMRDQTRVILSAQEDERRTTSRQVHDEIAQTLVAINVKLLTLRTSSKANTDNLENSIAATQRLVQESIQTIHRVAQKLGVNHEA